MQPYYFPYAGYISLLKNVDIFILFDVVQFIRHGWIERNRILKPKDGWQYIKVPLKKHSRETKIKDIEIRNNENWREKTLAQLVHYKSKADNYAEVINLLKDLYSEDHCKITDLNKAALELVCEYLGIRTPIVVLSNADLDYKEAVEPGLWALNICLAINGVDECWNPIGGQPFMDKEIYSQSGIDLKFHNSVVKPYNQKRPTFEPYLSILDMMMFLSKQEINKHLDSYEIS